MDEQAPTTPESRQALRLYLQNRRLTASVHHRITAQSLDDLEEALNLLQEGLQNPTLAWTDQVEEFLLPRLPAPSVDLSMAFPGLFEATYGSP